MAKDWFLESIAADGSHVRQPIRRLPFRVGRDPALNDFVVDARGLSRQHAVLEADASGRLRLTDLGSTNGTFLNRDRIDGARLVGENDVIHFGNAEFRLGQEGGPESVLQHDDSERTMIVPVGRKLTEKFVQHERQFNEVLAGKGIAAAVQPIVELASGRLFAYELLGRCKHPELDHPPGYLFKLAEQLNREVELSAAFLDHGVPQIAPRLNGAYLFVNAHEKETFTEPFFQRIQRLRQLPSAPRIVVEVNEKAMLDIDKMLELAARLKAIGVPFAYDDFGAGQSRLAELGDVPPDFVKFDMGLVRGLHTAGAGKQEIVRDLVRMVLKRGAVPLAEGVEDAADGALCRDMGFQLIQGYLTGRPVPVESV